MMSGKRYYNEQYLPHWNKSLASLLASRLVYAVDSEQLSRTSLHCQPGFELNLTCQGRGILRVGTQAFPLTAGTLVFIPEPVVHQLEVRAPARYIRSVLCIAPMANDARPLAQAFCSALRKPPFLEPQCLYLEGESFLRVRNLISRIATEAGQQADWWQEIVFALAYELLAFSARLAALPHHTQPPSNHLAEEAAAFVAAHLDADLTTTTVAGHFGVSREHLSRIFHQHFGVTYQHYVMNQRINAARRLLTDTNSASSLLDIALAAGFQSHSHFSRVFRKHEGITPTQFRALYHSKI